MVGLKHGRISITFEPQINSSLLKNTKLKCLKVKLKFNIGINVCFIRIIVPFMYSKVLCKTE